MSQEEVKKTRKNKAKTKAPTFLEEHPEAKNELQLLIEEFTNKAKYIVSERGFSADVSISFAFYKEK
jgi:hypothetical protein